MKTCAQKQNQTQKRLTSSLPRSSTLTSVPKLLPSPQHLQRTSGNQAMIRMLQANTEESKPSLAGTASPRFADDFNQMSAPSSAHSLGGERESEPEFPAANLETVRPSGQPLEPATRAFMESRFGHDFGGVRVHTDAKATESARAVNARAYTVGADVVLGEGQPSLETTAGRQLLAHELAHVVQQSRGGSVPDVNPSAPHEKDARMAARVVGAGLPSVRITSSTGVGLARDGDLEGQPVQTSGTDPRLSPRYIDNFAPGWEGRGTYSFVFEKPGGPAEKDETRIIVPPEDIVRDETRSFVPILDVYKTRDEALKTVKEWSQDAPGFEFYSFYRGPNDVILPTVFSKDSTPVFHAVLIEFEQILVEQTAAEIEDIQKGLQSLANAVNPFPATQVGESGDLSLSGNPLDWVPLLKLRRLNKIKEAGPVQIKHHSGHGQRYKVMGPHGKLKGISVYILKDAEGTVLYVGKGFTLERLRDHIKDPKKTQWFGEISEVEVKATGLNNTQALALEQDLIGELNPLHNIDKTPFRKEFGDTMEVGPNLPKPQKPFKFWIEWGHQE